MRLRNAQLPGKPCIIDGIPGGRAGAAVIGGNQDDLGPCLGHACGHRAHTCLRHQLDGNPGLLVGIFQIIYELGQVLDGIYVMMGRRRYKADPRGGMPCLCHPRIHLLARQLSALAGLGALCHLDLDFPGADQIPAGDPEPPRSNLFDGGTLIVLPLARRQTFQALAALARVGFAVNPVHGNRQALMGLLGNGAIGHGARLKAGHDGIHALHLVQGDSSVLRELKVHQGAQMIGLVIPVNLSRILLKCIITSCPGSFLQQMDGKGIIQVFLLARTRLMASHAVQGQVHIQSQGVKGR